MSLCSMTEISRDAQFDRNFAERLVREVQDRPMMYDAMHPDYKDRIKVDQEWTSIAAILGAPVDYVRKRWQNLRGSYSRSIASKIHANESSNKKVVRFYLEKQMDFLKSHMVHAPILMNDSFYDVARGHMIDFHPSQCKFEPIEQDLDVLHNSTRMEGANFPTTPTTSANANNSQTMNTSTGMASVVNSDGDTETDIVSEQPKVEQVPDDYEYEPPVSFGRNNQYQWPSGNFGRGRKRKQPSATQSPAVDKALQNLIEMKTSEANDPDFEFFRGLLPHVKQLNKRNKRHLFQEFSNNLFCLLLKQDDGHELPQSPYSTGACTNGNLEYNQCSPE